MKSFGNRKAGRLRSFHISMNRRYFTTLLAGSLLGSHRLMACLWDRDTLADELKAGGDAFDLILGQFPHHGEAYYRLRIARLGPVAEPDLDTLNDLAVAHIRLKEFAKATLLLEKALQVDPDHYPTRSNLGVCAKKQGDFEKAALWIGKALEINPEGHMGLGDWYLRAMNWRAKFEKADGKTLPAENYCGNPYAGNFEPDFVGETKKPSEPRHLQMVRNDQSFADGFAALGDDLAGAGDLHLSLIAHTRAMLLGHQNPKEIRRRRRELLKHQEMITRPSGMRVRGSKHWMKEIAKAEALIGGGQQWLAKFKATEAGLLRGLSDERKVDFTKVLKEMEGQGIKKVAI